MRNYYGAEQWKKWILECSRSGMEIKKWCKCHNLSDNLFFRWRKRLVDLGEMEWPPRTEKNAETVTADQALPQVIQVNLPVSPKREPEQTTTSDNRSRLDGNIMEAQIMIETPVNGYHIYIGNGFSQETLKKVMEVAK